MGQSLFMGGGKATDMGREGNEMRAPYYGEGHKNTNVLRGRIIKSLFISYMYKFPQFQNPYFQFVNTIMPIVQVILTILQVTSRSWLMAFCSWLLTIWHVITRIQ